MVDKVDGLLSDVHLFRSLSSNLGHDLLAYGLYTNMLWLYRVRISWRRFPLAEACQKIRAVKIPIAVVLTFHDYCS